MTIRTKSKTSLLIFVISFIVLLIQKNHDAASFVAAAFAYSMSSKISSSTTLMAEYKNNPSSSSSSSSSKSNTRRTFLSKTISSSLSGAVVLASSSSLSLFPKKVHAVGPIKISLLNPTYFAKPCPPSKPIPGEKAMKGMRGLCVTVTADLDKSPEKDLDKVGVYGFVLDEGSGESVLANNPDLNTDAGQFTMIEKISTDDTKVEFEFVAAIPREKDTSEFDNGIGALTFDSLRIISFPGGQQYGAINPCEMNEFSDECSDWEEENGPYVKGKFMMNSNPRTKGR